MKNDYLKEFPRAFIIGLIIFGVLILIQILNGHSIYFNQKLGVTYIYTAVYTFSLHFTNTFLFRTLDKIFATERFSVKRIAIGFVSSFFVSLFVIFLVRLIIAIFIEHKSFYNFIVTEESSDYILTTIFTFVILLIVHFIYIYKGYQENKVQEQKIIAGTASAKFESLKNQIDPHFLFNSLNVLSSLIEENPENAQKFTTSLSKIYRYVLEQKDKELVPVEEELAFAKTYMNLLKMRFESSITFELPQDFDIEEAKVVPLSLQLLLENTIKHNVVSAKKPLHIKIFVKDRYLVVENNLQKKAVLQDRQGVGLQNIVNRYGLISERKVIVEENESHFTVLIPILTKQIVFMETKNILNENRAYEIAKERVFKLKAFYGNLTAYCCVIPLLIFINVATNSNFQWFWFPMLGWGLGLTFHASEAFDWSSSWEEKKIQEIINKAQSNTKWK